MLVMFPFTLGRQSRPLFGNRFAEENVSEYTIQCLKYRYSSNWFFQELNQNLRPRLRFLRNDDERKAETRRLQEEIDKINRALTEEEKNTVLMDPMDMDPMGYICSKEVLELNEITYLDQLLCFNTTEEQCYKVST